MVRILKILIISPTFSGIGGVARNTRGLKNYLESEGYQVDVISSENTFTIPIRRLKNPSFAISAFFKTRFKKYDVILAQHPLAAISLRGMKGRKILALHGVHHEQVKLLHGKIAGKLAKWFSKFALNSADLLTVSSKEMLETYSKLGYQVRHIPNALDLSDIESQEPNRMFQKQIIFVGRLSEEKGLLTVLEMAKMLSKDIHVVICGDGPLKNKVLDATCTGKVHYIGFQKNPISFIKGSDILIQPSLFEGGTSYTLLEAMACKTAIVCTNAGGSKDVLTHHENCLLVSKENPNMLLMSCMFLLENPTIKNELTENAFNDVKKFDWHEIGNLYLNIFYDNRLFKSFIGHADLLSV